MPARNVKKSSEIKTISTTAFKISGLAKAWVARTVTDYIRIRNKNKKKIRIRNKNKKIRIRNKNKKIRIRNKKIRIRNKNKKIRIRNKKIRIRKSGIKFGSNSKGGQASNLGQIVRGDHRHQIWVK